MKIITAALGVVGLTAAAVVSAPIANAAPAKAAGVTATYGCSTATFTNNTSKTVYVSYGLAGTGMERGFTPAAVAPGKKVTVTVKRGDRTAFGWLAKDGMDRTVTQGPDYPGLNITKYCSSKPTAEPTKKQSKSTKSTSGGLAKTGA